MKISINKIQITVFAACCFVACKQESDPDHTSQSKLRSGVLVANMDTVVNPGDNFFNYVNGGWIRETEIPADESAYGVFDLCADKVDARVIEIVKACANGNFEQGSDEQLVGDLFASVMDTKTRNTLGLSPLKDDIAKIDAIASLDDLAKYMGSISRFYGRSPLKTYVWVDELASDKYSVYLVQSGLGLPDREYYLADNENYKRLRAKYLQLIETVFSKANMPNPKAAAKTVYTIEHKLAEIQMPKEEAENYQKLHHIYATNQLNELTPNFNWNNYLSEAGLKQRDSIVINMVEYTRSLNTILANTSVDDWKTYLKWCLIDDARYRLSEELYTTFFTFYGKELYGVEAERPQWEKAIFYIHDKLGQLVVKLYGKQYISVEAINKVEAMIEDIRHAYKVGIEGLDWMSPETKNRALEKLSMMSTEIVYPKKLRDYSNLLIKKDDYYGNYKRLEEFYYEFYLSRLDQPVDREDSWIDLFSGSYSNSNNTFRMGAVFFQPPYFDEKAENATNFAGIGSVIGHEIGHAFDDRGSQFDGKGNLMDWWNESDRKEFQRLSKILTDQFNQYKVLDSIQVNGEYTVNENMADLTSVVIPLKAYQLSLNGKEGPVIDNFTATQRFFISYGQVWMTKTREAYLMNQIATDNHAPNHLRVNGIVRNVPEFYTAFDIKESDSLYLAPADRIKIW